MWLCALRRARGTGGGGRGGGKDKRADDYDSGDESEMRCGGARSLVKVCWCFVISGKVYNY